mmetsp:Transcript_51989/g.131388  ORF Transcript_51989/g.131388 Transcript_51989/m.131388 type:complete len:241 (+) Transcript_51989:442-1164(+)
MSDGDGCWLVLSAATGDSADPCKLSPLPSPSPCSSSENNPSGLAASTFETCAPGDANVAAVMASVLATVPKVPPNCGESSLSLASASTALGDVASPAGKLLPISDSCFGKLLLFSLPLSLLSSLPPSESSSEKKPPAPEVFTFGTSSAPGGSSAGTTAGAGEAAFGTTFLPAAFAGAEREAALGGLLPRSETCFAICGEIGDFAAADELSPRGEPTGEPARLPERLPVGLATLLGAAFLA